MHHSGVVSVVPRCPDLLAALPQNTAPGRAHCWLALPPALGQGQFQHLSMVTEEICNRHVLGEHFLGSCSVLSAGLEIVSKRRTRVRVGPQEADSLLGEAV